MKKYLALILSAVMALAVFAGCGLIGGDKEEELPVEQKIVGSWKAIGDTEAYVVFEDDGTCQDIVYVSDADICPDGMYIAMDGTYEIEGDNINRTFTILGKEMSGTEVVAAYFGDKAIYETVAKSEIPTELNSFDDFVDLAMDYVKNAYAELGYEATEEELAALREELEQQAVASAEAALK